MIEMPAWIVWSISLANICGSILNIKKIHFCFWIWSVCNVFWLIFDIINDATHSRAILDVMNLSTSIWGIVEWHKKSASTKESNSENMDNSKDSDTVESI